MTTQTHCSIHACGRPLAGSTHRCHFSDWPVCEGCHAIQLRGRAHTLAHVEARLRARRKAAAKAGRAHRARVEGRRNPTTARFWIMLADGWARLSLRDGESLSHCEGGPHEEGYSWTTTVYLRDGSTLTMEEETRSRDCDGSYYGTWSGTCEIALLSSHDLGPDYGPAPGVGVPLWEGLDSAQRDFSAEQAGY